MAVQEETMTVQEDLAIRKIFCQFRRIFTMLGRIQARKIPSDLFLMASIMEDECVLGSILFAIFCAEASDGVMCDLKEIFMIHFTLQENI